MRILVVGGTGFIGARVVERLATEHEVTVLHRGKHVLAVTGVLDERLRIADVPDISADV
jgi:nucleoside-diphosphate-sugar epimerase